MATELCPWILRRKTTEKEVGKAMESLEREREREKITHFSHQLLLKARGGEHFEGDIIC